MLVVLCFMDFSIYGSVVRTVSGLAGGASISGPNNNLIARESSVCFNFATLAM